MSVLAVLVFGGLVVLNAAALAALAALLRRGRGARARAAMDEREEDRPSAVAELFVPRPPDAEHSDSPRRVPARGEARLAEDIARWRRRTALPGSDSSPAASGRENEAPSPRSVATRHAIRPARAPRVARSDQDVLGQIRVACDACPPRGRTVGKIHSHLHEIGLRVSRERVGRLMREAGLVRKPRDAASAQTRTGG